MKTKLLLLLIVLVALILIPDESEGSRRRRYHRRRFQYCYWARRLICGIRRYKSCTSGSPCVIIIIIKYHCHYRWYRRCNGGRRDTPNTPIQHDGTENDLAMQSDSKSRRVYIPYKFSDYDTNKDSRISLEEFYSALKMWDRSTKPVFESMDKNGDKFITCDEFRSSKDEPFKRKPIC